MRIFAVVWVAVLGLSLIGCRGSEDDTTRLEVERLRAEVHELRKNPPAQQQAVEQPKEDPQLVSLKADVRDYNSRLQVIESLESQTRQAEPDYMAGAPDRWRRLLHEQSVAIDEAGALMRRIQTNSLFADNFRFGVYVSGEINGYPRTQQVTNNQGFRYIEPLR